MRTQAVGGRRGGRDVVAGLRRLRGAHLSVVLVLSVLATVLVAATTGHAQESRRIGDDADPVMGAILISQASHGAGEASHAVVGRDDVFADNLAATPLVGRFGTLLFTTGGPDAPLRDEVLEELRRALGDRGGCSPGDPTDVYIAGGEAAVSAAAAQAIADAGFCTRRLGGQGRVATAIALADATGSPSSTVVLARAGDWADAAAIGSWAAATNSRVLVTPSDTLAEPVAAALSRYAPTEILMVGGTAALSAQVEQAAAAIAPVRRVAGVTRDHTAVAIADQVWGAAAADAYAIGHGYASSSWTYLFAAAPLAGRFGLPILYADDQGPTEATMSRLEATTPAYTVPVGPPIPPDSPEPAPEPEPTQTPTPMPTAPDPAPTPPPPVTGDLDAVEVALEPVATMDSPLAMVAHPTRGELWVAERPGVVRTFGGGSSRVVLDISATVSTSGERGLLGLAISVDGRTLYTSSTDTTGTSVLDAFDITGDTVDASSRRRILAVPQPASNHNGGDLHLGPDGNLWWSLGDGGGSNDEFGNGQRPDTLLGTIVRIDPTGGDPYAIPPDNPFVDGGGAPEVWAYGLRNPFRFTFDPATHDVHIADVGQGRREEVDVVPLTAGAGSNFGWPIYEGTLPFAEGTLDDHVPPVWETSHEDGNCSITGGVVYRGSAIPELQGAYLYADLCNPEIHAITVVDGVVTQDAALEIAHSTPVGFGVDHAGEVYVLSLGGTIAKIVPA